MILLGLAITTFSFGQNNKQKFVSIDIDNFWVSYDKIIATSDSIQQYKYLKEYYLDKATDGLKSLIEAKRYTEKDFINAINKYPKFWNSIRQNTYKINDVETEIEASIQKLREVYPNLKSSTIYFSIGGFRSNGTIQGNKVLISCEMALSNKMVNTEELPESLQTFYKLFNPLDNIALLCTHEYVHTQQKMPLDNLLCNTLYEGVAEFTSCFATNKPSNTASFDFGKKNEELVKTKFIEDLFIPDRMNNWLWGQNLNELKERDLGYYIGYRICENYYAQAKDKKKAIKDMIELDYTNDKAIENFVDKSRFFSQSIKNINRNYEKLRPKVLGIVQFKNGSKNIKSGLTQITIRFSKTMSKNNTGIDFGELGENYCPKISPQGRIWSEDGKTWTFEADLKPNQRYQILISNNFRTEKGIRLKPYLIDITTTN